MARNVLTLTLLLIILVGLGVVAAPHLPPARDFLETYYPAIQYALDGQNPYTGGYALSVPGSPTPPHYGSPPWLLLILLPFGLLPYEIAQAEWVLFLVAVTFAGCALLEGWGVKRPWSLFLIALPWSLFGIMWGQVVALVFFGAVLAITQAARNLREVNTLKSALLILLGLILMGLKPQLGLTIGSILALWLLWRRDRRLPLIVGGGLLFLLLVWLLGPAWPLAEVGRAAANTAPQWKATLEREFALWGVPIWLAWPIRAAVVAVMALWAWRRKGFSAGWWAAWLAAALIVAPYTRGYDGALLIPALGQMTAQRWPQALLFALLMVGYATLFPFGEIGSVVAPLAAFGLSVPWQQLLAPSVARQRAVLGRGNEASPRPN